MIFPSTDEPFIQHNGFVLSGNDCISIAKTLELMREGGGFTDDPRYYRLFSLFKFIVHYVQQRERHQEQKAKHLEQIQRKALEYPIGATLFSPLQYNQLLVQIKAWECVTTNKQVPDTVQQILRGFYDNNSNTGRGSQSHSERVQQVIHRMSEPATAMVEVLANATPSHLPPNVILKERNNIVKRDVHQRVVDLQVHIGELERNELDVPLSLRVELKQLKLIDLQRKIRHDVCNSIPLSDIVNSSFRKKKDIEHSQKVREKQEKKIEKRSKKGKKGVFKLCHKSF